MKNSIIIVIFFIAGILLGMSKDLPDWFYDKDAGTYALYVLLFLVGAVTAADPNSRNILSKLNKKVIAVPFITIAGTYAGVILTSLFIKQIGIRDALAVGSGFGYYSLSSIMISEIRSEELGVIALFSNIFREIFTLLFAPLLVKYFGKLSPVVSGGATSMDTTLPVITKYSGKDYVFISVFHGLVLSTLVPAIITLIYSI